MKLASLEQLQNNANECSSPRDVFLGDVLGSSSVVRKITVPCGDWRSCPYCAKRRRKRLWSVMFQELAVLSQLQAGMPLRVLTLTLTLDKEYGARYGNEARERLRKAANRVMTRVRAKLKKECITMVLYAGAYDLHKDSALHRHIVIATRGVRELSAVFLNSLGRTAREGARVKAAFPEYTDKKVWLTARCGGYQWQYDRYKAGQDIAVAKTAAWYCLKYALKRVDDWQSIQVAVKTGMLIEGRELVGYAYKGMRWAERSRSVLVRAMRRALGFVRLRVRKYYKARPVTRKVVHTLSETWVDGDLAPPYQAASDRWQFLVNGKWLNAIHVETSADESVIKRGHCTYAQVEALFCRGHETISLLREPHYLPAYPVVEFQCHGS